MVELTRANEIIPGSGSVGRAVIIQGCKIKHLRKLLGETEDATGFNRWLKATAKVAEELEVPMLSVCDVLLEAGLGPDVFLDRGHLDPRGLRALAEALFALLAEHDMLPDPVAEPAAKAARR